MGKALAHIKYVGYRSREMEGDKGFFDKDNENIRHDEFWDRVAGNKALKHSQSNKVHKMIFSLKENDYVAYKRSGKDYKDLVRSSMEKYEIQKGVKLDWIASIHDTKGHPHVHIVIKGVSDIRGERGYERIKFKIPDDMRNFKESLQNEFEKDVRYKWHERQDVKESIQNVKTVSKGLVRSLRDLQNDEPNKLKANPKKNRFREEGEKRDRYREER